MSNVILGAKELDIFNAIFNSPTNMEHHQILSEFMRYIQDVPNEGLQRYCIFERGYIEGQKAL